MDSSFSLYGEAQKAEKCWKAMILSTLRNWDCWFEEEKN